MSPWITFHCDQGARWIFEKSSVKFGITSIESGKFFSKNSATSPLSSNEAKNSHLQMA
jgi:hypothetical protein